MQISKFFSFCLGLLSLGGDGAPRYLETGGPINHGLQRTLGPWNQDSAAYAEGRRQQFTTKASSETPGWTEAGLWVRRPLCRKIGDGPFPHMHSQQPLLYSLSTVSWSLWCFLREHHPEEATSNWSKEFATNSLRRGSRDSCLL